MNKKITTYFLNMIRNKYLKERARYSQDKENFYVTDGYILRVYKKSEFELNIKLFNETKKLKDIVKGLQKPEYQEAEIKYYIPNKLNKGCFYIKIQNEEKHAYIDKQYLDLFNDCEKFKILGELDPVLCFKQEKGKDILLGCILPVRVTDEHKL
jgi:hypothetical protein